MESQTRKLLWRLILPLVLAGVVVLVAGLQAKPDFLLHAYFFDVGQGDSMMIKTYLGRQVVIDGGPTDAVLKNLGKSMPFFDRTIDLLILTHPHADHVSGLVDVLKRYKVKQVLLPDVKYNSSVYTEFLKLLAQNNVQKIFAHTGQRIWLDPATVFDVYYPQAGEQDYTRAQEGFGTASSDLNDTSIVGKLIFGKTKILFTGDAGTPVEFWLDQKFNLQAQILKVAHHGSQYSTSTEFVSKVAPQYAVIEVGQNTYGHPTQATLNTLNNAQVQIFRTDQDKTIEFVSDGTTLSKK